MLKGRSPTALVEQPTAHPRGVDATTDSRQETRPEKSHQAQTSAHSGPMWDSDGNDGESAVRLLGADYGDGTTSSIQGTTARAGSPQTGAASKSAQLETLAGSSMDSIDDAWDIEAPVAPDLAATKLPQVTEKQPASSNEPSLQPTPALPSASAPSSVPTASTPVDKSVSAPAGVNTATSKVRLAAEAYQRRAGARTGTATQSTTPAQPPVAVTPSNTATPKPSAVASLPAPTAVGVDNESAPSAVGALQLAQQSRSVDVAPPQVEISAVVELAEPLELQEVALSGDAPMPPPLPPEALEDSAGTPDTKCADAEGTAPAATPANQAAANQSTPAQGDKVRESIGTDGPRRDSVRLKTTGAERRDSGMLSLEASDAVEFFSSPPPAMPYESELDQELAHEPHQVRTPQQLARQQYLRRLVFKFMLAAITFLVVVIYLLWQRGLLHFVP